MKRSGRPQQPIWEAAETSGDSMTALRSRSRWALVLAGGDGTRLRPLTRRIAGDERPKQFCRVLGDQTLLDQTLRRCARAIPPERTLVSVVRAHERFYVPLLAAPSAPTVVVQPENRGTAPAILYGLLRLLATAATEPVAIFPSDHYVSDDEAFMAHVGKAFEAVETRPDLVVLLGIAPDSAEADYGWIEPGEAVAGSWTGRLRRVGDFWEKPSPALARRLRAQGCLWNSFVIVAHPSAIWALGQHAVPSLVNRFAALRSRLTTPWEDESVRRLYARLPSVDFSRHVLATRPASLAVLAVSGVEWNDLGDPRRVMATLARPGVQPGWESMAANASA